MRSDARTSIRERAARPGSNAQATGVEPLRRPAVRADDGDVVESGGHERPDDHLAAVHGAVGRWLAGSEVVVGHRVVSVAAHEAPVAPGLRGEHPGRAVILRAPADGKEQVAHLRRWRIRETEDARQRAAARWPAAAHPILPIGKRH